MNGVEGVSGVGRGEGEQHGLEELLVAAEVEMGRLRVVQVEALRALDLLGTGTATDGPGLVAWVATHLDLNRETAQDLVFAARAMSEERLDELRRGVVGFERALHESRHLVAGGSERAIRATRPHPMDGLAAYAV
jgi:hypothetical protein